MSEFVHPAPHALTTARLTLTDLVDDDFASYYAIDLDERVTRYIGTGRPETRTFEQYRDAERVRLSEGIGKHFHVWTVRARDRDDVLGRVLLRPMRDFDYVEVGYRLAPASWGKGYATEATRAVLAYGFDVASFSEITAVTYPENNASQQVLMRCGFTPSGVLKRKAGDEVLFFRFTKVDYEKLKWQPN
jgi:[ribosomal protein S5]-alanine N-acetyltransferase